MRRITTFLLCLFCVVTLTTPTVLAARMLPVFAVGDTAHCQAGVEHSDQQLTETTQAANPPIPLESDAGACTDCSSCLICACQCHPLLATSNAPQIANHSDSMPEPTQLGRCGITAAPELKPPRA
ncbi:MAG: hypothetical protein KA254_02670 [Rhodoferax sp.]|nr:hypothetical protein [Rhodoferax sp.]